MREEFILEFLECIVTECQVKCVKWKITRFRTRVKGNCTFNKKSA